jgi:hypothetical protein
MQKQKLYSYWKAYACGCRAHLYKTPVYEPISDKPCFFCEHPEVEAWVEAGKDLKAKRKSAKIGISDIPGLTEEDVLLMERGRRDPAPLKAFLEGVLR